MTIPDLKTRLGEIAQGGATPPVTPTEGEPATPVAPILETDHAKRGTDLDVTVQPDRIPDAARIMDQGGYTLEAITGVDWIADKQYEVVYDFTSFASGKRVAVRTRVPRDIPALPSIHAIFPGANWHERETHDFFGIKFSGHPQLTPLLLPEDATFHPLRKDFGT
ncbi:MAG: NADH-quinone oxidoreductase subunit C [bacterium]